MTKKIKAFEYSASNAEELFLSMAAGETVREFCRRKKIPHSTCLAWVNRAYPDQYAHAREELAYFWADEIIEIADDTSNDYKTNSKGEQVIDNEAIQRSKLKVETRKWLLSKIAPKAFGDSLEVKGKIDTNVTTTLPPEIAEMIASMKKGDKEEDDESPTES